MGRYETAKKRRSRKRTVLQTIEERVHKPDEEGAEECTLNFEQQRIAKWLKEVKFRKRLFGGVSERDVWKKLLELNEMYNAALAAERARYDALLKKNTDELQAGFREYLNKLNSQESETKQLFPEADTQKVGDD